MVLALLPLLATFAAMGMTPALIILALMAGYAAHWRWPKASSGDPTLMAVLVIVLLWSSVSGVWSITPGYSFESAAKLIGIMLIGVGGVQMARTVAPLPRQAVLAFAISFAFCAALLALERGLGLIHIVYNALHIDYARFIDKNVNRGLCALVMLAWPVVLGLHRLGYTRAGGAVVAVILLAVLGMDSLSATLALIASIIVFGAVYRWPIRMPHILAVAVPIFFITWPLMFAAIDQPVFADPHVYNALPTTAQHRVEIWRFALGKVLAEPWWGWGFESSRAIPGGDVVYQGERKYIPLHPHNSVIQILLELGVVGLMLWTAALSMVLRRWRKVAMPVFHRATAGAAMTAYLSIGFTAFGAWQTWWIATGWLVAMLWLMLTRGEVEAR
jgi:O-antigen ligase